MPSIICTPLPIHSWTVRCVGRSGGSGKVVPLSTCSRIYLYHALYSPGAQLFALVIAVEVGATA